MEWINDHESNFSQMEAVKLRNNSGDIAGEQSRPIHAAEVVTVLAQIWINMMEIVIALTS